jgi:hypothetical protein
MAVANRVKLEVRGNHDYYGHLYIGEEYVENRMIYDTTSAWTTINAESATGNTPVLNNYKIEDSRTAQVVYSDAITRTPDHKGLNFGSA